MSSEAEIEGMMKAVAKTMSVRDLKWQIANRKKLRISENLNQVFKVGMEVYA